MSLIFFYFHLSKKIRMDVSCESSALQRIHMKYQVLFSQKNNEKVFMNVVCCSCDWRSEQLGLHDLLKLTKLGYRAQTLLILLLQYTLHCTLLILCLPQ